jgi:hypothetical protein
MSDYRNGYNYVEIDKTAEQWNIDLPWKNGSKLICSSWIKQNGMRKTGKPCLRRMALS